MIWNAWILPLGLLAWLVQSFLTMAAAHAAEMPKIPQAVIETGMHTTKVNRIGVDDAERFLVSGGNDKTIRVWNLADGRLLRTIRVPIAHGNTGKIYAVA